MLAVARARSGAKAQWLGEKSSVSEGKNRESG